MNFINDFDRIEQQWQPNGFVRFMESNPITRLFWQVIKCCFGYDDHYRCDDWSHSIYVISMCKNEIQPGHPLYPRYYRVVKHVLYYNPHLRGEFIMSIPPVSNPVYVRPPVNPPQAHDRRNDRVSQTANAGIQQAQRPHHRTPARSVPLPTSGVDVGRLPVETPLSQANRAYVPPPTSGVDVGRLAAQTPLSQANRAYVPPPTSGVDVGHGSQNRPVVVPAASTLPAQRHSVVPGPTTGSAVPSTRPQALSQDQQRGNQTRV